MTRRSTIATLVIAAMAAVVALALPTAAPAENARPSSPTAGLVRDDIVNVVAPIIIQPVADVSAGIDKNRLPAAPGIESAVLLRARQRATVSSGSGRTGASAAAAGGVSGAGIGAPLAGRLATVTVRPGDRVVVGQVVAQLDDTLLQAGVRQALAAEMKARADVRVLEARIDDVAGKRSDLRDARAKLVDGLAKIRSVRADLVKKLAQARKLAALMARGGAPGSIPPGGIPTGTVPPGGGGLPPSAVDPRALIAKLEAAIAQLDAQYAKAQAGLTKLDSGRTELADARTALENARDLATIGASARGIAVQLAWVQVAAAEIRSPIDGVVVEARRAGETIRTGAPVVRIRPDGPSRIDTYLAVEQGGGVASVGAVDITSDSFPNRLFRGSATDFSPLDTYPPAGFPTDIVHLIRAFRVTVTLEGSATLPPGTWVDMTWLPEG